MRLYFLIFTVFMYINLYSNEIYTVNYGNKKKEFVAPNDIIAAARIKDWIVSNEIEFNHCLVDTKDIQVFAQKFCTAKNVTYDNFCVPNQKFMMKIHNALLKVIGGMDPIIVYKRDITENTMPLEIWNQYVLRYNTKEKLAEYVKEIPVSMDIVIKSFIPQARFFAERWILYSKIIKSSGKKYYSISKNEKRHIEKEWWNKKLEKLKITFSSGASKKRIATIKENILNMITVHINWGNKIETIFIEFFGKRI